MPHRITLIPGDGIGPEVAEATKDVLAATGVSLVWDEQDAGLAAIEKTGDALPKETIESCISNGVALKGPTTTPVGGGHTSANVRLRRELDLYASVRPTKTIPGVDTPYKDVDLVVFRENTEGLYSGWKTALRTALFFRLRSSQHKRPIVLPVRHSSTQSKMAVNRSPQFTKPTS